MKDEKLDKLFQDAAQGMNFGDGASAWDSMKSRLTDEALLPEQKKGGSFKWTALILAILLLSSSAILVWNLVQFEEPEQQTTLSAQQSEGELQATDNLSDQINSSAVENLSDNKQASLLSEREKRDVNTGVEESAVISNETAGIVDQIDDVNSKDIAPSASTVISEQTGNSDILKDKKNDTTDKLDAIAQQQAQVSLSEKRDKSLSNDRGAKEVSSKQIRSTINDLNEESTSVKSDEKSDDREATNSNNGLSTEKPVKKTAQERLEESEQELKGSTLEESASSLEDGGKGKLLDNSENTTANSYKSKEDRESVANLSKGNAAVSVQIKQVDSYDHSTINNNISEEREVTSSEAVDGHEELVYAPNYNPGFLQGKGFSPLKLENQLFEPLQTRVEVNEVLNKTDTESEIVTRRSRWSIGLAFAPDLSGTGLTKVEDSGFNLGLNVEYHINSKFSINSGVTYAKKIYFAEQGIESYRTNPNWELDRVNANCDVIDIPVNLNYYVAGRERSGFVFSAGLSTYFMLTEDYDIVYEQPWPGNSLTIRNENNHFLGVLNASIGYRKILNPTLSIQAEPFVKVPLQGIGDGNIDLFTSGFRLTLKFNKIHIIR